MRRKKKAGVTSLKSSVISSSWWYYTWLMKKGLLTSRLYMPEITLAELQACPTQMFSQGALKKLSTATQQLLSTVTETCDKNLRGAMKNLILICHICVCVCLCACFSMCVKTSLQTRKMKSWNESQHAQWGPEAEKWINDAKQEWLKGACGMLFYFHCLVEDNKHTMLGCVCKTQTHTVHVCAYGSLQQVLD